MNQPSQQSKTDASGVSPSTASRRTWIVRLVVFLVVLRAVFYLFGGPDPQAGETRIFDEMEFVWIPAGKFVMGSHLTPEQVQARYGNSGIEPFVLSDMWQPRFEPRKTGRGTATFWFENEHPQHEVKITKGFWLGKYEVTNAQFREFKSDHDSGTYGDLSLNEDGQPVVEVLWQDTQDYCRWLSKKMRGSFRLPTEAEWEYACRAGTRSAVPWGAMDSTAGEYANVMDWAAKRKWRSWNKKDAVWTKDGYAVTAPVGSYKPNQWGVHDMIGNVWEWCDDWYGDYSTEAVTDPVGPDTGEFRVLRGGSWGYVGSRCRSAVRNYYPSERPPEDSTPNNIGFRVVRIP